MSIIAHSPHNKNNIKIGCDHSDQLFLCIGVVLFFIFCSQLQPLSVKHSFVLNTALELEIMHFK